VPPKRKYPIIKNKNDKHDIPSSELLKSVLQDLTNASNQLACLYSVIARASEALVDAGSDLEHLSKNISTIHKTVSQAESFLARELAFRSSMND
jgi:hypothetical protein